MLRLFKQNNPWQVIIILAISAALWIRAFANPQPADLSQHLSILNPLLAHINPQLSALLALLLAILEGLWLNLLLFKHKIIPAGSLLPTLLYVVAIGWAPQPLTLSPLLFANLMIIAAINQLLSDGTSTLSIERNFNASFCIGLATLCFLPACTFIIYMAVVVIIYKMYNWRQLASILLGFIGPAILLFIYAFLADKIQYLLILINYDLTDVHLRILHPGLYYSLRNLAFLALLAISVIALAAQSSDSTINNRINSLVLLFPLLASAAMTLYSQLFPLPPQLVAPTFAYATTLFLFTQRKRQWINDTIFVLLLILSLLNL